MLLVLDVAMDLHTKEEMDFLMCIDWEKQYTILQKKWYGEYFTLHWLRLSLRWKRWLSPVMKMILILTSCKLIFIWDEEDTFFSSIHAFLREHNKTIRTTEQLGPTISFSSQLLSLLFVSIQNQSLNINMNIYIP